MRPNLLPGIKPHIRDCAEALACCIISLAHRLAGAVFIPMIGAKSDRICNVATWYPFGSNVWACRHECRHEEPPLAQLSITTACCDMAELGYTCLPMQQAYRCWVSRPKFFVPISVLIMLSCLRLIRLLLAGLCGLTKPSEAGSSCTPATSDSPAGHAGLGIPIRGSQQLPTDQCSGDKLKHRSSLSRPNPTGTFPDSLSRSQSICRDPMRM